MVYVGKLPNFLQLAAEYIDGWEQYYFVSAYTLYRHLQ